MNNIILNNKLDKSDINIKLDKSNQDTRIYEYMELPNKLKLIIITESNINALCSCALSVGVGHIDDTYDGIAHFLEHMLFMGTINYPEEDYFLNYIAKNGGSSNAMTADKFTTYYYTIKQEMLLNSLNVFSDFFINPLLKSECIDREILAVDSEHSKNLLDNSWITLNISKKIFYNNHPAKKFSTGNLKTLQKIGLREKVIDFYLNKYSSHLMNVIISINKNIDKNKLLQIITNTFGNIKLKENININRNFGNILLKNKLIKYVPSSDIQKLIILYEIPTLNKDKKKDPALFISYLIAHKGDNSLFSLLSTKSWIYNIFTEIIYCYDDYSLCIIEVALSELGYINRNSILKIILEYITLIKTDILNNSHIKTLYEEYVKINKINYEYWINPNITELIINLSSLLIDKSDPKELLSYGSKLVDYNNIYNDLLLVLDKIKYGEISVLICSKLFNNTLDKTDELYNTQYNICSEIYNCDKDNLNINLKLTLPKFNKYIVDKLPSSIIIKSDDEKVYKLNDNISKNNFYYQYNTNYSSNIININIALEFSEQLFDNETYLNFIIGLDAKYNYVNGDIYLIETAGHTIVLDFKNFILHINITSINPVNLENSEDSKVIDIVEFIINMLLSKNMLFISAKNSIKEKSINFIYDSLKNKTSQYILKNILTKYFLPTDYLNLFSTVNKKKCLEITNYILSEAKITVLVVGDFKFEQILKIDKIISKLNIKHTLPINRSNVINFNEPLIYKIQSHINTTNTYVSYMIKLFNLRYGETKNWGELFTFSVMYSYIFNNRFFDELRTKQQLGYIVHLNLKYLGNMYYTNVFLEFNVQSQFKKSDYIINKIKQFITNTKTMFSYITDQEFEEYKHGLISLYKKPFDNLHELSNFLFIQILEQSYLFNKRTILIDFISKMTRIEFDKLIDIYIINNNKLFITSIES